MKEEKDKIKRPGYVISKIVDASAEVAKEKWGIISPHDDFSKIVESIEKAESDRNILQGIWSFLRGRKVSMETMDQLRNAFEQYKKGDNKQGLQYDEGIDVYYFTSVLKSKTGDIRSEIGRELSIVTNSEVAEKLDVSKDHAKIIWENLKGTEEFKNLRSIDDERLLRMVEGISYNNGGKVAFMDDFVEKVTGELDILPDAAKSLYERNKEGILRNVSIYSKEEIENMLKSAQEKTNDGLFEIGNGGITQSLVNLMIDRSYALKVIERGVYLPIFKDEKLRDDALSKFSVSFATSIRKSIERNFERRNYVMLEETLKEIVAGEYIDKNYSIEDYGIREKVVEKIVNELASNLDLRDSEDHKILRMRESLEKKVQEIKDEIIKKVIEDVEVAISAENLEKNIDRNISDRIEENWDTACDEYVKSHITAADISSLAKDKLKDEGWTVEMGFIMSPGIDKYRKDILEEIKKDKDIRTGEMQSVIEKAKRVLEEIIGEKYGKLDESSKLALKEIVLKKFESMWEVR